MSKNIVIDILTLCCFIAISNSVIIGREVCKKMTLIQETKNQTDLQKMAVRLRRHTTLSPTERPRHFSTPGSTETGRKKTVDTRHTLTQFGDWSGPSRPLSSACAQGIVVWVLIWRRHGISDTSLCERGQADQTPDHVLQSCPKYGERRQLSWPQGADLATKL